MRVVLDTNVLVSAALWGGAPRQVLEQVHNHHQLCFSLNTLQELERVLTYPKLTGQLSKLSFSTEEFMERLTELALVIPNPPEERIVEPDSSDDMFIACAVACHASLIGSGDEHLLHIGRYQKIEVVTPKKALQKL